MPIPKLTNLDLLRAAASPFARETARMMSQRSIPDPFERPASTTGSAPTSTRRSFVWPRPVHPSPRPFTYAGYAERVPPPVASPAPTPSPAPVQDAELLETPARVRPLLGA